MPSKRENKEKVRSWPHQAPPGYNVATFRTAFLGAVEEEVPDVPLELQEIAARHSAEWWKANGLKTGQRIFALMQGDADFIEFVRGTGPDAMEAAEALVTWARGYHLESDWCLDVALSNMAVYARLAAGQPGGSSLRPGFKLLAGGEREVIEPADPDLLNLEREESYRFAPPAEQKKMRQNALARRRRDTGWEDPTAVQAWVFRALALWQCAELKWEKVAEVVDKDPRHVREEVDKLSKLIGLQLRKGTPGRKRGDRKKRHS